MVGPKAPGAHRAHTQPCSCVGPGPARAKQLQGCVWALWAPGALDHGPYGPQGPWAQPLFDCVAELFFLFGILGVPKNKNVFFIEITVYFVIFAILANVDPNLKLTIYKIAIYSSVRNLTYFIAAKRRVSENWYERMVLTFLLQYPMKSHI